MTNNHAYSPVLYQHLAAFFAKKDFGDIPAYLDGLSHSDFRKAGLILGESILPGLPEEEFWDVFLLLLQYHPKALLGTMMKAAAGRMGLGRLSLKHPGFKCVVRYLNGKELSLDKQKIINYLLPVLDTPDDAALLLAEMQVEEPRKRIDYLLRHSSLPVAYLLFQEFRRLDYDKDFLARCCRFLMKRGDALSFNLASVCKSYFDLPSVAGTFSLRLKPYELGLLEASYVGFCSVMRRVG